MAINFSLRNILTASLGHLVTNLQKKDGKERRQKGDKERGKKEKEKEGIRMNRNEKVLICSMPILYFCVYVLYHN